MGQFKKATIFSYIGISICLAFSTLALVLVSGLNGKANKAQNNGYRNNQTIVGNGGIVYTGSGIPDVNFGTEGDSYINTDTMEIYIKKNGNWVLKGSVNGNDGQPGLNGVSVVSITKTGSHENVDEYTITYSDGSSSKFYVTNGTEGPQGIQGVPGTNGHTPIITVGANGNWYVDGADTGVKAQGPKGADGRSVVSIQKTDTDGLVDTYTITYSDGTTTTFTITNGESIQGEQGPDGRVPVITIGANGNWFVDGVDTGQQAQGQPGAAGRSVVSITYDSSEGNVDTYIITYSDGSTSSFTVTNGADGQSIQGEPGPAGHTPVITINANGYWVIDGVNTGVKAVGSKGEKGDQGVSIVSVTLKNHNDETNVDTYEILYSNGETSEFEVSNGVPPTVTIGANGNWYVNGVDTGVAARGDTGDDGVSIEGVSLQNHNEETGVDTYVITYSNGDTSLFYVTNGHSPVIAINGDGYWTVDGVSTGVKAQGQKGDPGDPGSKWYCGAGDPDDENGANGDFYLNTTTYNIFEKVGGHWTLRGNIKGENATSAQWIQGTGAPSDSQGNDGDLYLDQTDYKIYSKSGGTWSFVGYMSPAEGKTIDHTEVTENYDLIIFYTDGTSEVAGKVNATDVFRVRFYDHNEDLVDTKAVIRGYQVPKTNNFTARAGYHDVWSDNDNGKLEDWKFLAYTVGSDLDLYLRYEANEHRAYLNLKDTVYSTSDIGLFTNQDKATAGIKYDAGREQYYTTFSYGESFYLPNPYDDTGLLDFGYWKNGSTKYNDYVSLYVDEDITFNATYGQYLNVYMKHYFYDSGNSPTNNIAKQYFVRLGEPFDYPFEYLLSDQYNTYGYIYTPQVANNTIQFDDMYFVEGQKNPDDNYNKFYSYQEIGQNLTYFGIKDGATSIRRNMTWNINKRGYLLVNMIPGSSYISSINATGTYAIMDYSARPMTEGVADLPLVDFYKGKRTEITGCLVTNPSYHTSGEWSFRGPVILSDLTNNSEYGTKVSLTYLNNMNPYLNYYNKSVFKSGCFKGTGSEIVIDCGFYKVTETTYKDYITFESGWKSNFSGNIYLMLDSVRHTLDASGNLLD